MNDLLLATAEANSMWYSLPLITAVSLVYAATRHEEARPILRHAGRIAVWIVGFMAVIFLLLWLIALPL